MRTKVASFAKIPFVRDVATMQIGRLITIGGGFVTSIFYVRYLGLDGYGEYAIVLAFVGMFGLITNLGQQATFSTFFAESYGRKDRAAMVSIAQYYVAVSTMVALLLALFLFGAPLLATAIYADAHIGELAQLVFLSSMFEFAFSFYAICLQVVREIRLLTILENTKTILQIGGALLLLALGYGVAGILLSSLAASVLFCILACVRYPHVQKKYDLPHVREMMQIKSYLHIWKYAKDGMWIAIDKNVGNLYPTVFLFALSTTAPKPIVGLLRLAFKLADLPASFALNSVSRLGSSVLSTMAGKGGDQLRAAFFRLTKHTLFMHTAITAAGMFVVPPLLPIVYDPNFKVAAYPFLIITVLQLSYGLTTTVTPILRVHSKIYLATITNVVGMTAALSAFFLFAPVVTPTRALYIALLLYHVIMSSIAIPTWKILRRLP